jgi:kynurenine formamidase
MQDLTHPIEAEMPVYPGDPVVEMWPDATYGDDGYRVSAFGMGTHTGTHVDAPGHVEPDGRMLDDCPLERFEGEAVVTPVGADAGAAIGIEPLATALEESDATPEWLLIDTGWRRHWGTEQYWDHPYLAPGAAAWCADRGLDVALDAPSVDPMGGDLLSHHELLGADGLIVENLTNLDGLPPRIRFEALPLALAGVEGAPVRALARTGDDADPTV